MNEIHTLAISGMILIFIAFMIPFVQSEFGVPQTDYNPEGLTDGFGDGVSDSGNVFTKIFDFFKVFVWTFGDLPFWLDAILLMVRVVFFASLVKLLPTT